MSKSKKRPTSIESLRRKQKLEAAKLEKIEAMIARAEAREKVVDAVEKLPVDLLRKLVAHCDELLRLQAAKALKSADSAASAT